MHLHNNSELRLSTSFESPKTSISHSKFLHLHGNNFEPSFNSLVSNIKSGDHSKIDELATLAQYNPFELHKNDRFLSDILEIAFSPEIGVKYTSKLVS